MHAALQGRNQSSIDKKKELRMQYWRYGYNNDHTLDYFTTIFLNKKVLLPTLAPGIITLILT